MQETLIRPASPDDAAAMLAVARQLPQWFTSGGCDLMSRDFLVHHGAVAVRDGQVVGFITYIVSMTTNLDPDIFLILKKTHKFVQLPKGFGSYGGFTKIKMHIVQRVLPGRVKFYINCKRFCIYFVRAWRRDIDHTIFGRVSKTLYSN